MRYEKNIRRQDGGTLKIAVTITTGQFSGCDWFTACYYCKLGEHKFKPVEPTAATPEEILEAKIELWNKIKPTL